VHPDFEKQDILEAAELVAFDVLEPSLRSRGGITDRAKQVYGDDGFRVQMRALLQGEPAGGKDYCIMIEAAFADGEAELRFPFAGLLIGKMLRAIKDAIDSNGPFRGGAQSGLPTF
jgi:hypothetical protein